jgi:hypothetical protein
MTAMIIPAAEGCWLLTYRGDAYVQNYTKVPVIAWSINPDRSHINPDGLTWEDYDWEDYATVRPITSKGEPSRKSYNWAVLHTDGTVSRSDVHRWYSLEVWLEQRRRAAQSKAEREAKAQEPATLGLNQRCEKRRAAIQ